MPFVERTKDGVVTGVYSCKQPGYAEEYLKDDHPDVVAYRGGVVVVPPPDEDEVMKP